LINTWVEKKTNDKIKDLIKSGVLNHATRLVLVNAVYFKGDWAKKFKVESTKKGEFHLANGSSVETDMMSMKSQFRIAQVPEVDATALEIPYKGDRLSMIFILPNETLVQNTHYSFHVSGLLSISNSNSGKNRASSPVPGFVCRFQIWKKNRSHYFNTEI
jgi:serine protease inhibitor